MMARSQRSDPEIPEVLDHLENKFGHPRPAFSTSMPEICVGNSVFYNMNSITTKETLLMIALDIREQNLRAHNDDPIRGHLGYRRTLANLGGKYF